MKKSEIKFTIHLDDDNVPEKIFWDADDKGDTLNSETKAIALSLWDHMQKNTLRIDLWSKDMPVDEMKRFYIDTLGGLSQSLLNSTGDEVMSEEINKVCDKLVKLLEKELKEQSEK